jgi:hypothetical protein
MDLSMKYLLFDPLSIFLLWDSQNQQTLGFLAICGDCACVPNAIIT